MAYFLPLQTICGNNIPTNPVQAGWHQPLWVATTISKQGSCSQPYVSRMESTAMGGNSPMQARFLPTTLCEQDGIDCYGWPRPVTKRQIAAEPPVFSLEDTSEIILDCSRLSALESNPPMEKSFVIHHLQVQETPIFFINIIRIA